MARTAQAATPGTDPVAALETNTEDTRTLPLLESDEDEVTRLKREMAELKALVYQMGKNQAVATAEPVKLPTMKTVQGQKPTIPILTEDGWYVPEVHPTDRVAKN